MKKPATPATRSRRTSTAAAISIPEEGATLTPMPGGEAIPPEPAQPWERMEAGRPSGSPIGIRQGGGAIGPWGISPRPAQKAPRGLYKTGRLLISMERGGIKNGLKTLSNAAGLTMAASSDFKSKAVRVEELKEGEGIYFEELGIALVNQDPDQQRALGAAVADTRTTVEFCEEERYVFGFNTAAADYLRGYRDGVANLTGQLMGENGPDTVALKAAAPAMDERSFTWGLQAIGADASAFNGQGIKLAILDTGLDSKHTDFKGRLITVRSFTGEPFADIQGHGTHCTGTACGSVHPERMPRYGIAHEAHIFSGKVLDNEGFGTDGGILQGIDWAVGEGCEIVSMSLGAPVEVGESYSRTYEKAGRRALRAGTLIIAAAGNESERPGLIAPVGRPANCPSIMAVAAVDARMGIAYFSCGGLNPSGGQVDIAGPGVDILSAAPGSITRRLDGTSMATPHVAGAAALWAQAVPDARGRALAHLLISNARRLELPSRDAGAGLVRVP